MKMRLGNLTHIDRILIVACLLLTPLTVDAQTTSFNYQGRLTDGGNPANGSFQMQFKLFDALAGGTQIGSTLTDVPVTASNGVFSARLDFGSAPLAGADRWIEIAVRRNSGESYVTLSPREQIVSSPYAVKSLTADTATTAVNATNATTAANASQLGGLPPSRYVQTDASGNVGIGVAPAAGAKLTVGGQLAITSGSIKFPDATTQSTAGLTAVTTTGPFTGNGTAVSPLGITSPLQVQEINPPGKQPFRMTGTTSITFTVPAGKLLVLEYVGGQSVTAPTLPAPWLSIQVNNIPIASVPIKSWSDLDPSTRIWMISEQLKIYVSAGQTLLLVNGSWAKYAHGYLIDAP
jgi:hypothetical protein